MNTGAPSQCRNWKVAGGLVSLEKKKRIKEFCIQQVKGMTVHRVLSLCVSAGEVPV